MPSKQFFLVNNYLLPMSPVASEARSSRDNHATWSLKSSVGIRGISESGFRNETPSGTPSAFYGMLTRSSLLDASVSKSSTYNTPVIDQSRDALSIYSNLHLSQSPHIYTSSSDPSRHALTNSSDKLSRHLVAAQKTIADLTLENKELREHIDVLSGALQNSTLLIEKKERLIQERDTFIREFAARLLLDRQRQS